MFNEMSNNHVSDSDVLGLMLTSADSHNVHMTGEIIDRIHYTNHFVHHAQVW